MAAPRLYYLAEAHREVLEAFEWYLDRSPQAAAAFLHELDSAIALIAEAPDI
jgi:plasmid stabilization system protein ParE